MSPGKLGEPHYIPHYLAIRDDKTTTKIRIVFDESARDNGPSLNDCLYKGPHLTPLLYSIKISSPCCCIDFRYRESNLRDQC